MATFCLTTGQSPETYRSLTRLERQAFYDVLDDAKNH
jgi:hypothetical protein